VLEHTDPSSRTPSESWTMSDRRTRWSPSPGAGASRASASRKQTELEHLWARDRAENDLKRQTGRQVSGLCKYWIMASPPGPTHRCNTCSTRETINRSGKTRKFSVLTEVIQHLLRILQRLLSKLQHLLYGQQRLLDDLQQLLDDLQRLQGRFASCQSTAISLCPTGILPLTYR
jgi:hypothetical protein